MHRLLDLHGHANYNDIGATTITDTSQGGCDGRGRAVQVTYDGDPHTATVTSITGVNGETGATVGTVNVSNTTHTNAGIYNADFWTFTGTANYNNICGDDDHRHDQQGECGGGGGAVHGDYDAATRTRRR